MYKTLKTSKLFPPLERLSFPDIPWQVLGGLAELHYPTEGQVLPASTSRPASAHDVILCRFSLVVFEAAGRSLRAQRGRAA